MKEGSEDQKCDIFFNTHHLVRLLKGGTHLEAAPLQVQRQTAWELNLTSFLLAQLWTKISMQLMTTKPANGACISDAAWPIRGQRMQSK